MPELTYDIIEACKTDAGSWTKSQLEFLGVSWPPRKGWRQSLIGKELSAQDLKKLYELRKTRNSPVKSKKNPPNQFHNEFKKLKSDVERLNKTVADLKSMNLRMAEAINELRNKHAEEN